MHQRPKLTPSSRASHRWRFGVTRGKMFHAKTPSSPSPDTFLIRRVGRGRGKEGERQRKRERERREASPSKYETFIPPIMQRREITAAASDGRTNGDVICARYAKQRARGDGPFPRAAFFPLPEARDDPAAVAAAAPRGTRDVDRRRVV